MNRTYLVGRCARHHRAAGATVALEKATSAPAESGSAPSVTTTQTALGSPSHDVHRGWGRRHLFHGLRLTADERTQLKGIRNAYRPQVKILHHQAHVTRSALRNAEAQHDSAAIHTAARASMHETHAQFATLRDRWIGVMLEAC